MMPKFQLTKRGGPADGRVIRMISRFQEKGMRRVLCLFLVLTVSNITRGQQSSSVDFRVSGILVRMESKELPIREAAFGELMTLVSEEAPQGRSSVEAGALNVFLAKHPDQADRIKLELIQLVSTENDLFVLGKNAARENLTEEDGEYHAAIITAVSSLDDDRSIPVLVGAMTTGGIAQRGLLKYGDKALGPVMDQLENRDALFRSTALGLSISLLKNHKDQASVKHVTDLIKLSLTDPNSVVRRQAVREIDCLAGRQEFVSALERIAKTDPEKRAGKALDGGDREEFYPVRYDARRVLRDIQNNRTCNP